MRSRWLLLVAGVGLANVGLAACTRELPFEPLEPLGRGDGGARDADELTDGTDLPDMGVPGDPDRGVRDRGVGRDRDSIDLPLPGALEGAECTSTATATSVPFRNEDCWPGLLCVPWDLLAGLTVGRELERPVKTCLLPCNEDRECGPGRWCGSLGFAPVTGAQRVCIDRVAGYDQYCSGSRLGYESVVDPVVTENVAEIVACAPGLTCQFGQFNNSFNPDEAVCAAFCQSDADCAGLPDLPYCNPRVLRGTSSPSAYIGVCSDGKHPNGAVCGSADPSKSLRISTDCDTSEDTCGASRDACPLCIGINLDANRSLTPQGTGICMSPCNNVNTCAGGRTCVGNFFTNGDGVCSDACSSTPDTCAGAGSLNHGQDCLVLAGDASFCVDRYIPSLAPAQFDSTGILSAAGDDCVGDLESYSFFRCPDGATCVSTDVAGYCVYGCTPADPSNGDVLCQSLLSSMSAICAEPTAGFGVCGQ